MPTVAQVTQNTSKGQTKKPRRKLPLVAARRGRKLDDDDDETAGTEESYTDDSGLSEEGTTTDGDSEDDEDEDETDIADTIKEGAVANGNSKPDVKKKGVSDTETMKTGIRTTAENMDNMEAVDFEDMGAEANSKSVRKVTLVEGGGQLPGESTEPEPSDHQKSSMDKSKKSETPFERRRREHEEYKKKRAEDPSFVPNRGRFFMHDHRYDGVGSNGFRPYGPSGRGRGGRHGDFHGHASPPELAAEWPHDMHEQVETEEQQNIGAASYTSQNQGYSSNSFAAGRQRAPDQPRTFGRTLHKGTVQIQVKLPGMQAPITFSEVPCKAYTRLPYHRPPLRRDKPVRVALPDTQIRYIYPSIARSFIFIPRAMRPGGSGYIRGTNVRGRGSYSQGRSIYGGGSTAYSPSAGMSRRSSIQYDTRHQTPAQTIHGPGIPVQAPFTQESQTRTAINGEGETGKPVVRLPSVTPSVPNGPSSSQTQPHKTSTPRNVPQHPPPSYTPSVASYTPSINPIPYREARATPKIPMYQPRPQKTVNVAEIDSPHVVHFPQNYSGGVYTEQIPNGAPSMVPNGYPQHQRHPSYPSQTSGTPLSQIPESMHPRPFHPGPYPPQGPYYHPYPPHAMPVPVHMPTQAHGYHPPPPPYVASGPSPMPSGMAQHYAAQAPMTYQHPVSVPVPPPPVTGQPTGPTTIAQESNGMVYYSTWDPNTYYPSPANVSAFNSTPSIPVAPVPDGQGQNVGGTVYYYPSQPQTQQPTTGTVYYSH